MLRLVLIKNVSLFIIEPAGRHSQEKRQHPHCGQYNKLNNISCLGQLSIARVDEVLDSLGKGRISLFDFVSSIHQITVIWEKYYVLVQPLESTGSVTCTD